MLNILDPELVLFAEVDGKTVGWFPGVPNMNEILIHVMVCASPGIICAYCVMPASSQTLLL
jgi:hypothetical protein